MSDLRQLQTLGFDDGDFWNKYGPCTFGTSERVSSRGTVRGPVQRWQTASTSGVMWSAVALRKEFSEFPHRVISLTNVKTAQGSQVCRPQTVGVCSTLPGRATGSWDAPRFPYQKIDQRALKRLFSAMSFGLIDTEVVRTSSPASTGLPPNPAPALS